MSILLQGRRVLIGTPAHDWKTDVRWTDSFGTTIKLCAERGINVKWLFPSGQALVQQARNELVRDALRYGFDDLVFIDADQDWRAEDFVKLLSYDVDCVGAPIRKKTDEQELYNVYTVIGGLSGFKKHPNYSIITSPDLALGTGFIRFSRYALHMLWDSSEKYSVNGAEECAWIFDVRPKNGVLVGEDTIVSFKLRERGIETWVDPAMTCGHIGLKRWEGNFGNWLERMRAQNVNGGNG